MSGVNPNSVRKPVTAASITDATAAGRDMLTAADVAAQRTLLSVYSTAEVDGLLSGLGALTAEDIDTLAEINAIITDANFATVATSGSYNDLTDKPTIPAAIASGTITPRDDDIDLSGGSIGDVITVQADGSLALSAPAGGAESPLILTAGNATEVPLRIRHAPSSASEHLLLESSTGSFVAGICQAGAKINNTQYYYGTTLRVGNILLNDRGAINGGIFVDILVGFKQLVFSTDFRLATAYDSNRLTVGPCKITFNGGPAQDIRIQNIPTSDPAVAGQLYNDNGTLKISAG